MQKYVFALMGVALLGSAALAAPDDRSVVQDHNGNAVTNDFGHCVRTDAQAGSDACGAPKVAAPARIERKQVAMEARTLYFDFNKSTLNETEKQKLDALAGMLKDEASVRSVSIVGYADHIGSASYNDKLSQERAKNVENYLHERGYAQTNVTKTRWFGEAHSQTHCPNALKRKELIACLQKDRRVEVELDYVTDSKQ